MVELEGIGATVRCTDEEFPDLTAGQEVTLRWAHISTSPTGVASIFCGGHGESAVASKGGATIEVWSVPGGG